MAFSTKSFLIGIFVALVIGLVLGYGVVPHGVDTKLEQQINQLKGELNTLQSQMEDKNEQIANLQSRIENSKRLYSLWREGKPFPSNSVIEILDYRPQIIVVLSMICT